jgi:hypothetical protein
MDYTRDDEAILSHEEEAVPITTTAILPQWTVPPTHSRYGPTPLSPPSSGEEIALRLPYYNLMSEMAEQRARRRFFGAFLIGMGIWVGCAMTLVWVSD